MPSPLVYLNGRFIPFAEAALPLHDAGFVSGATIVDNARTFRQKLFRWPDHLDRFRRHCEACYIPLEFSNDHLTAIGEELIERNVRLLPPGSELHLVTFATPGPLGFYVGGSNGPATFGMATHAVSFERYRRFFIEGVSLAVAGIQSSDSHDLVPPPVKHRSRLSWHVAERTINDRGSRFYCPNAVPVVLNHLGIGDTAIGSLLAVVKNAVICPVPETVLESISVKVVGELCRDLGIRCEPLPLDWRSLCADDAALSFHPSEVLLTGTGFTVAGVKQFWIGDRKREFHWPGPVYRRLMSAWSERVGVDIERQFRGD